MNTKKYIVILLTIFLSFGASAQVELLKDVNPGPGNGVTGRGFFLLENGLIFEGISNDYGDELWVTDGTEAGTQLLIDIKAGTGDAFVGNFVSYKNEIYFTADDGVSGGELWKTDATPAGTKMVMDLNPGSGASVIRSLIHFDDQLYFLGTDGSGMSIWKTDGTSTGAVPIFTQGASGLPTEFGNLVASNDKLYFTAKGVDVGVELWVTDGTEAGTSFVKDIRPGFNSSNIRYMTGIDGKVYFAATTTNASNWEPWVSDGTESGTFQLKEIAAGDMSSNPQLFTGFNGAVLFSGDHQLWTTDGTAAGTTLLKDISLTELGEVPNNFRLLGDLLYFPAKGNLGYELWSTDGTDAGTVMVKDIGIGGSSSPSNFTYFGDQIIFAARNNFGREVWITDGTEEGTSLLADINTGIFSSDPSSLTVDANNLRLYAKAWRSDFGNEIYSINLDIENATNELIAEDLFQVYPNPTIGEVTIELPKDLTLPIHLDLITLTGKVLNSYSIDHSEQVNLSHLSNGIYLLRIMEEGRSSTKRLVISK